MPLDAKKIPADLTVLIPLVEKWGSCDELRRSTIVENSGEKDLNDLVDAVKSLEKPLFEWLSGPESFSSSSNNEYIAFSNLVAAFD